MKKHPNLGQAALVIGQVAIAAGDLALEYSNSKKLAKLQSSFSRMLDSDSNKIDYVKDIVQRIQIAAVTLAHTGKIQPKTALFDKYLALLVKDDMQYIGNCNVKLYQPARPYDPTNVPKSIWITIDRAGRIQPSGAAPLDVGTIWSAGCQDAEDQAGAEYIEVLKGQQIAGGLWTGLRGRIQQLTQADIGTIDLFMRIGLGTLFIAGLILVFKVQGALIEEQEGLKYTRKIRRTPPMIQRPMQPVYQPPRYKK